jgi:hypothetical protein
VSSELTCPQSRNQKFAIDMVQKQLDSDALNVLERVLTSRRCDLLTVLSFTVGHRRFLDERPRNQLKLCEVVGEFLSALINKNMDSLRNMCRVERQSTDAAPRPGQPPPPQRTQFRALLRAIALVFKVGLVTLRRVKA